MGTDAAKLDGLSFSSTSTYRVLQELGRGGMGIVYLAEKNCEGVIDHVVLKTLRSISGEQVERLRNEANIATILRHENIVKTYGLEAMPINVLPREVRQAIRTTLTEEQLRERRELDTRPVARPRLVPGATTPPMKAGSDGGAREQVLSSSSWHDDAPGAGGTRAMPRADADKLYCLAMDYVEGTDLGRLYRAHLRSWLLVPPVLSAFVISRVCRALAYAHQYIVHRDISPENILINTHGVAKLTDFGIAVAAGQQTGLAGKVMYMAPEQLRGEGVDKRSDIYSLGLVAYQIVTGINLFHPPPGSIEEAIAAVRHRMRHLTIPPPHLVRSDVPEILSSIIMKMLQSDPAERYSDMEEVGNDLEKKYLYAAGFGPTNNSLAAYIRIFESDFKLMAQQDLRQLTFLESPNRPGKLSLRRLFSYDSFTRVGKNLIKETQRGTLLFKVLEQQAQQTRRKNKATT